MLLTDSELQALFEKFETSELGRQRILWIRQNAPIRAVGGGSKAVKVRYVPLKMPFVLEAEAFQTEYAALVTFDHDNETLEMYTQPAQLKITYINGKGKKVTVLITPDLFLIQTKAFVFIECKTEEDLKKLAEQDPERYSVTADGRWHSPPAERAAAEFGCEFRIRSTAENNWALVENLEFVEDFLQEVPEVPEHVQQRILSQFDESAWVSLHDLIHGIAEIKSDWIYTLIVQNKLYFDWVNDRIADYERALVFRDQLSANAYGLFARSKIGLASGFSCKLEIEVGTRFGWDGRSWSIVNVGESRVSVQQLDSPDHDSLLVELTYEQLSQLAQAGKIEVAMSDLGHDQEHQAHVLLRGVKPDQLESAKLRYEVLFGVPNPDKNPYFFRSARAKAYWLAEWRESEQKYGYGFIGLIPNLESRQGNRKDKLDPTVLEIMAEVIDKDWETVKQKSVTASYGKVRNFCHEKGLVAPSTKTFRTAIFRRHSHEQQSKRLGEKAAYDLEPQYLKLEYTTPRHGTRPFQIGHIDHTPLPIKVRDKTLQKIVKSIWLTVLIDAFSRKILAFYLSFDEPSYRSCLMVLRDCVRRHTRLTKFVVVDQGPEFISTYFESTLAFFRTNKKERPAGKPRFGSVMERVFNTTMTQMIYNLTGNTQIYAEHYRQIGKDVDPERHAIWTLDRLAIRFEEYVRDVYHKNEHSTLGMSPDQAFLRGLKESGERTHRLISYNRDFLILTCPSTKKGDAKITPRGVKINYLYYKCAAFHGPGIPGTRVPVRYEPFNIGIAYACVEGHWHECQSEHYAIFHNYTERAIRLASQRLLLRYRRQGRAAEVNAERLAEFLASTEAEEVVGFQMLHDQESADHRNRINKPKPPQLQPAPEPASADAAATVTTAPADYRPDPRLLEDL